MLSINIDFEWHKSIGATKLARGHKKFPLNSKISLTLSLIKLTKIIHTVPKLLINIFFSVEILPSAFV